MDRRDKLERVSARRVLSPWDGLVALAVLLAALSVFFAVPRAAGAAAEVYSDNVLVCTLPLNRDAEVTVRYKDGYNVVKVSGGKVGVTGASCGDRVCVNFGWIEKTGMEIVCLPNRLIVRVRGGEEDDSDWVTG